MWQEAPVSYSHRMLPCNFSVLALQLSIKLRICWTCSAVNPGTGLLLLMSLVLFWVIVAAATALVVMELVTSPLPPALEALPPRPDLYCEFPIRPSTWLAQSIKPLHAQLSHSVDRYIFQEVLDFYSWFLPKRLQCFHPCLPFQSSNFYGFLLETHVSNFV